MSIVSHLKEAANSVRGESKELVSGLAEDRRQGHKLSVRVQRLEQENRGLQESFDGLREHVVRIESG
jgi:predicted nuclease with TOPRIM domain